MRSKPKERETKKSKTSKNTPFVYMAYVYVDGQPKYDDARVIPVDPKDERYSTEGEIFKGRALKDTERNHWRFLP
jgi:hypothetical protein